MRTDIVRFRGRLLGALACALLGLASTRSAEADLIPVASADRTGSRAGTTANQSEITFPTNDYTSFTIDFDVTFGGGLWTYTYHMEWLGKDSISHFSLAASDGFNETNVFGGTTLGDMEFGVVDTPNPANPIPTDLSGFKFDFGGESTFSKTYILVTDKNPVWGSFYAKVATGGVFNSGWTTTNGPLDIDPVGFDKSKWIPVPDTLTVIPEPSSIVLVSMGGLGAIGLWARRRRHTKR